jgi:hypothetical protein
VDPVQGWGYEGDIDWVPVEFFGSLIVSWNWRIRLHVIFIFSH